MKKMHNIYLGDIHGNFGLIHQYIDLFNLENVNLIQLGDFGIGFKRFEKDKRYLQMFHQKLVKNNVFVYAIRGNHDYKPYFDNDPFNLTNIKLVKDYTVLNLGGENILFVGGAISVDRMERYGFGKDGETEPNGIVEWWKDEEFILDEEKLNQYRDIDVVVTHTAPAFCYPLVKAGFGLYVETKIKQNGDDKLRTDLLVERHQLSVMFDILKKNNKIKSHVYGHFHQNYQMEYDGIKHILIGIGETWEDKSKFYED
jgi:predicted phosphodiesterase